MALFTASKTKLCLLVATISALLSNQALAADPPARCDREIEIFGLYEFAYQNPPLFSYAGSEFNSPDPNNPGANNGFQIALLDDSSGSCLYVTPSSNVNVTLDFSLLSPANSAHPGSIFVDTLGNGNYIEYGTPPVSVVISANFSGGYQNVRYFYNEIGIIQIDASAFVPAPYNTDFVGRNYDTYLPSGVVLTSPASADDENGPIAAQAGESFPVTMRFRVLNSPFGPFSRNMAEYLQIQPDVTLELESLVAPAGGVLGELTIENGFEIETNSSTTAIAQDVKYSEVGIINVNPKFGIDNFMGSIDICIAGGLTQTFCQDFYNIYADLFPLENNKIGRFTPSELTIIEPTEYNFGSIIDECECGTDFNFINKEFKAQINGFEIQAVNADGEITQNYTGAFNKLPSHFEIDLDFDTSDSNTSNLLLGTANNVGGFFLPLANPKFDLVDNGAGTISAVQDWEYMQLLYPLPAADRAPFDLEVEVSFALIDSDGIEYDNENENNNIVRIGDLVTSGVGIPFSNPAGKTFRQVRLALDNVHGSELLQYKLNMALESYNGYGWVRVTGNSAQCTHTSTLPYSGVNLLTVTDSSSGINFNTNNFLLDDGFTPTGCLSPNFNFNSNGLRTFTLPVPGQPGYVDVYWDMSSTPNQYFLYDWNNDGTPTGPSARINWGFDRGDKSVIYQRETY